MVLLKFQHNIRSWLTGITGTLFTETLKYQDGTTARWGGDVSQLSWKDNQSSNLKTYNLAYDTVGRLTTTSFSDAGNTSVNYAEKVTQYDGRGNIRKLERYGRTGASTYGKIDDLVYTYSGNKVTSIKDTGSAAYSSDFRFSNGTNTSYAFTYDAAGRMTSDASKGITSISWNVLGLPQTMTFSSGAVINYSYAANGTKLRESCTASSTSGTAEEYNHYYPLGGPIAQYSSSTSLQPIKFQGKEWGAGKGLDLYDFGARRYDPAAGRWLSQDPLAEKYYAHSPYLFCAANPMRFVDPRGADWYTINNEGVINHYKERENESYDRLLIVEMGPPDPINSLRINDRGLLSGRSNLKDIPNTVNKQDMLSIFYFVSDAFINQEWGLYQNESGYSLVTSGNHDHVASPFDKDIWKIHSHSDTAPNEKAELESMGYWPYYNSDFIDGKLVNKSAPWYESTIVPNDLNNLRKTGIPSRVYFPLSGNVYQLNKNSLPSIVERRNRR